MYTRSFVFAAVLVVALLGSIPVSAAPSSGTRATVKVQWFVEGHEVNSPLGRSYYQASQPLRGLWLAPEGAELGRIYLARLSDRQPEAAVPLVRVEW